MEDDIQLQKANKTAGIVGALGLLGLGISVVSLILGIAAMTKVGNTAGEMNDKIEKAAALSLDMKKMEDKLATLSSSLENMTADSNSRFESITKQINSTVERIGTLLNQNRSLIEENRNAISEIAKRRSPQASAASSNAAAETQTSQVSSANGDVVVYKIKSGDTIAKIAPKYNVSVQDILSANPNVNPSRLMIGQEIVIPVKK